MPHTCDNVAQITINGHNTAGQNVSNVLHYAFEAGGSRADACQAVTEQVVREWQQHIVALLTNDYTVDGASWVDLDSATGSTGTVPPDGGYGTTGTTLDAASPPQVAFLVRKNVTGGRTTRTGRIYVAGVKDDGVGDDGTIPGATITAWNNALANFLSQSTAPISGEAAVISMVTVGYDSVNVTKSVTRKEVPEDAVGEAHPVTSLSLDNKTATQRRRNR